MSVVTVSFRPSIFVCDGINALTGYLDPESDGSLEEDLAARRYRALLPDDEYDSEDDY